jgi:homoserine dehydrogenase
MQAMRLGGLSAEQERARESAQGLKQRSRSAGTLACDAPVRMPGRQCRVAIVGLGTVGSAVARLLSHGHAAHSLRLSHLCNRNIARKRLQGIGSNVVWTESLQRVLESDADVIVELIGGLDPARDLVTSALRKGKSVVTANKQLIAYYGSELLALARDNGQYLGFEASVAGGIPVLSALQHGLAGDRLAEIRGILNGTCNYILSRIEQAGASFADALAEAQQAGFAEADPTADLDGHDAAAKLAILARVGLKLAVSPKQVLRQSIRSVAAIDFEHAHDLGCTIRQLSTAKLADRGAYVAVQPALVPQSSPFAKVSGSQNLVVSTGKLGGETSFGGHGAGGDPTAVAVVSDLLQAAAHRHNPQARADDLPVAPCELTQDVEAPQYLRFVVRDRPGIIAALATVFSRYEMNLNAVLQKPGHPSSALPFVITLEPCRQSRLAAALEEISRFDFHVEQPVAMPMMA